LPRNSLPIIECLLNKNDIGLELGSGRSSIWFAKRVSHLTSLEHNLNWYYNVQSKLVQHKLVEKVKYILFDNDSQYIDYVMALPDRSLDFAIIDGGNRCKCLHYSLTKVKDSGFIIFDNANWYIPSTSSAPGSFQDSRLLTSEWSDIYDSILNRRHIWIGDGVSETLVLFNYEITKAS